jgi:hypothetical protein
LSELASSTRSSFVAAEGGVRRMPSRKTLVASSTLPGHSSERERFRVRLGEEGRERGRLSQGGLGLGPAPQGEQGVAAVVQEHRPAGDVQDGLALDLEPLGGGEEGEGLDGPAEGVREPRSVHEVGGVLRLEPVGGEQGGQARSGLAGGDGRGGGRPGAGEASRLRARSQRPASRARRPWPRAASRGRRGPWRGPGSGGLGGRPARLGPLELGELVLELLELVLELLADRLLISGNLGQGLLELLDGAAQDLLAVEAARGEERPPHHRVHGGQAEGAPLLAHLLHVLLERGKGVRVAPSA